MFILKKEKVEICNNILKKAINNKTIKRKKN